MRGLLRSALIALLALTGAASADETTGEPPHRRVSVPVDHFTPGSPDFELYVEFGAPFDPDLPTVFLINDGQQFFVRPGHVAEYQERILGESFNAVGIVGRGSPHLDYPAVTEAVTAADGEPDWEDAWRVFNSRQWVEDIEAVRQALLGENGKVMLWGRSGGGSLVHEYLAVHGEHVSRAFTSAPAQPAAAAFAGVNPDRFWRELAAADPSAPGRLQAVLARPGLDRHRFALSFQRQNFFETPETIGAARLALLEAYEREDQSALTEYQERYQVDAMLRMNALPMAWPIRVRLFEFVLPFIDRWRVEPDRLQPDVETQLHAAAPLAELYRSGRFAAEPLDLSDLHETEAEILVLAGRHDHVVDYRGAVALAASYRNGSIVIADDTHTFPRLVDAGLYRDLTSAFLLHGATSQEFAAALERMAEYRWAGDE